MADLGFGGLPNQRRDLPDKATCDVHPGRPAVARVQGETDSFGCELHDLCAECYAENRAYARSAEARTDRCDWCKKEATDLRDTRDYEEGMYGPVYRVCGACKKRRDDEDQAELDRYGDLYGHDDDW